MQSLQLVQLLEQYQELLVKLRSDSNHFFFFDLNSPTFSDELQLMKQNQFPQTKANINTSNTFQLKLIQQIPGLKFYQIVVSLSEEQKVIKKKKKTQNPQLIYPKWNNDGLCYTPSFLIPQDKLVFQKIKDTFRQSYQEQINKYNQQKSVDINYNIRLPYPQDQKFCGVCKISYMNFQQHINSLSHKQNCLKSTYTKHIYELCQEIGDSFVFDNLTLKKPLMKSQQFNNTECSYVICQGVESLQNSRENIQTSSLKQLKSSTNDQQHFLSQELKVHL